MGVIAATVGSAVGLGNIWRFPYEAGTHGGGAFLLLYIVFIFIIGIPVMCAEFIMGRSTRSNIFGAFRALHPRRQWAWTGYAGILGSILILSFYSVVAGWTIEYFTQSATGAIAEIADDSRHVAFDNFTTGYKPLMWTIIFLLLNALILLGGIQKGIERVSNILMPLLAVLLALFCVNSLLLPGAAEGLEFLFCPDFSKITPAVLIGAMGQAFFSLSLGLGTMLTYAGYFSDRTPLIKSAFATAALDTAIAVIAVVIIFPAVFTFGTEVAAGPKLVFEVLPCIFARMPGGILWSALFFFLLIIASLTSTISMSETAIAFFIDRWHMSRRKAVVLNAAICMALGTLCALSFGPLADVKIFGLTFFSLFDYVSSNIILPLGGMAISIFTGWFVDRRIVRAQLAGTGTVSESLLRLIVFCMRYIAPAGIAAIFLAGL